MLRTILKIVRHDRVWTNSDVRRHMSFRRVKVVYKYFFKPQEILPYRHVCQIGDPVLRSQAEPIYPETIETPEFQRIMRHMMDVMRKYRVLALSANQIGLSYRIFIIEVTENHLKDYTESFRKAREMEVIPLKVFINPEMKIIDYTTIRENEECASVLGYSAVVPRAKTVKIEALDASGKPFVWQPSGWPARIVQHEMDHLHGKLYVDHMDSSTFSCTFWPRINAANGHVQMQFHPKSWLRRLFLNRS